MATIWAVHKGIRNKIKITHFILKPQNNHCEGHLSEYPSRCFLGTKMEPCNSPGFSCHL